MMKARSTTAATLTVLALSGASLALGASPAHAEFTSSFSFGKTGPTGGLLEEPRGVAVESSSGDVFVVSGANANELQSVVLSGAPTGGSFTLSFNGQTTTKLAYASNEKQTVTLTGTTSGSFKLEFNGQLSAAIPFNATAAEVQKELEALEKIGLGSVSVSGGAGGPYTVEFKGARGSEHAGGLLCHGEALNAGATCTPATVVEGNASAGPGGVQSALEALSTIGAGNVEVRGEENNYLVEFRGSFANTNVEQMACAGSGPTCTVATSVNGLNTRRVVKYNAAGTVVLGEFTGAGTPQGGFEATVEGIGAGVAVDNSTAATKGDIYVTSKLVVDRFRPKGSSGNEPNEYVYECQMSGTGSGCTAAKNEASGAVHGGVAVDAAGNVFYGKVSSVDELEAGASEVKDLKEAFASFGTVEGLAIAGNELYAVLSPASEERELAKLTLNAAHNAVEGEEEGIALNAAEHAVTTDPAGDLYVLEEESAGKSHVAVYAPNPTSSSTPSEEFAAGETSEAWGIAYSTQGKGRIYITEKAEDAVHVFESKAVTGGPEISGCTATVQTPVSELLSCMLKPNGEALVHFDYREVHAPFFSETTPRTVTGAGTFQEEVQHLTAATEYTFKLVAKNEAGAETGADVSFTTAPAVAGVKACAATGTQGESATLGGSTLETIGGVEAKWRFEYGLTAGYGFETAEQSSTSFPALAEAPVAGLEPNAEYHCRLVATDTYGTTDGQDGTFKTLAVPPLPGGAPASLLAAHAATLIATINPRNAPTTFHFEYGETEAYGQRTPQEAAGSGLGVSDVHQRIEGLAVRTVYHFRVVATNEQGMTAYGPDETFTTAAEAIPVVQTGAVSGVTPTSASISGTVDPEGIQTSYAFEVGTDTGYSGAKLYGDAGSGEGAEPITVALEDLAPGTTYHYRLTASNADGTSYGQDMTFTTPGIASPILQPLTPPPLAISLIAFPTEGKATTTKKLTNAQKLAKALKVCKKDKSKKKRAACEKQAHKKYGPAKKRAKKKK